jgi:DNA-binding NtrC family response regulator
MSKRDLAKRLDILVVNDSESAGREIAEHLRARHAVRIARGLRDAVDELVRRVPDAIVCDFELPPYRGDVLLSLVAREHPHVRRVLYVAAAPTADCLDVAHVTLVAGTSFADLLAALGDGD